MYKEEIKNNIKQIAKEKLPPNTRILLFGSQARGDANSDSDWDILILIDKQKLENTDFGEYAYPFVEWGWKHGEKINPLLYTHKDWEERHFTPFYKNIETEGIEIWN